MKLSIVTTLYKSAPYIDEFYQRASAAAQQLVGESYEIIFVNDGSPDNSLDIAVSLSEKDSRVAVIDLSRNFGHHKAIMAGLDNASGERVFLIDSDLEEAPEWLLNFAGHMEQHQCDVVYGVQKARVGSFLPNFLGSFFWKLINLHSYVKIPSNPMTCRLMTLQYTKSLVSVADRVLYLAGTFAWTGFKQVPYPLVKSPRPNGSKSTYSFYRKFLLSVDSFTSFSTLPLVMIFATGIAVCLLSILAAVALFTMKLLTPDHVISGFTSIMIFIWFFGGMTMLSIGCVGLYLAKIFQEVKRRPLFIVRNIYGKNHEESTR